MLQVLPAALFLAFSPVVVALVVLFLASGNPLRNSLAFTLPSIIGSMLVGMALIIAFNGRDFTPRSTASDLTYWGQIITAQPGLSVAEGLIVLAVFTLISTVGMWTLIVYKVAAPETSEPNIVRMRDWPIRHNRIILILEFGILGALTLVKGIIGLLR